MAEHDIPWIPLENVENEEVESRGEKRKDDMDDTVEARVEKRKEDVEDTMESRGELREGVRRSQQESKRSCSSSLCQSWPEVL